MTTTATGMITAFDVARGWGFITSSGKRVFFHTKNSQGFRVVLGMTVDFDYAPAFKLGQPDQAVNLRQSGSIIAGLGGDE